MPLMGCQIGSSAATERVDGLPIKEGSIIPPAPWTCTLPSPCGGAKACCACWAASFAFLRNPIAVSDRRGPGRLPGKCTPAQVHTGRIATDPNFGPEAKLENVSVLQR